MNGVNTCDSQQSEYFTARTSLTQRWLVTKNSQKRESASRKKKRMKEHMNNLLKAYFLIDSSRHQIENSKLESSAEIHVQTPCDTQKDMFSCTAEAGVVSQISLISVNSSGESDRSSLQRPTDTQRDMFEDVSQKAPPTKKCILDRTSDSKTSPESVDEYSRNSYVFDGEILPIQRHSISDGDSVDVPTTRGENSDETSSNYIMSCNDKSGKCDLDWTALMTPDKPATILNIRNQRILPNPPGVEIDEGNSWSRSQDEFLIRNVRKVCDEIFVDVVNDRIFDKPTKTIKEFLASNAFPLRIARGIARRPYDCYTRARKIFTNCTNPYATNIDRMGIDLPEYRN
ncbi:uncharacterized protein LOC141908996 [Tubulanus polymorphus]|uniref:uncharacterized protein LOC141908996 n=1 Tax=Tubulanus polymorphus TaxID=672921 RepID=UPI003DA30F0B